MHCLFSGCSSLVEVPILDISKVKEILYMFDECSSLKTVLFADKIKGLEKTWLPFLKEIEYLPDTVKVKLLMSPSDNKDKKVQAMIKLYKD
jgi:hypothetical protein